MSLNETPSADRVHIAFFGRTNTGKSSLVNAVTGQNLALVSEVKGTTTDPVFKAMELLPLGPVVIIDTPGFDDKSLLGEKRMERAKRVLNKTDAAVLVITAEKLPEGFPRGLSVDDAENFLSKTEKELIEIFKEKKIPYIIVLNKCDLHSGCEIENIPLLPVSAKTGFNINLLKEKIASLAATEEPKQKLAADLIRPLDFVVLVIPIDKAAPKGRLILPQQQMIREILDAGGVAISVKDSELEDALKKLGQKPALVITDSQVFAQVSAIVPPDVPLTSFSILFARYKGFLKTAVRGASSLDSIKDGDKILICEGCTHHRQCDDIGTVKIPALVRKHTSKEPEFIFCSGGDFPQNLSPYSLIIHCGACMLNEREMHYRRELAENQNIPFTNYGITIAHIQGILERSIAMFDL